MSILGLNNPDLCFHSVAIGLLQLLLAGCPQFLIDRLQKVQNVAARLTCRAKNLDHVQPILQLLHWLPIRAQIQYKISTLCYSVITGTGPQYLSELLHLYRIPRFDSKAFG